MPMAPPLDMLTIDYVLENKKDVNVRLSDDNSVHAKVCHLNRWRRQIIEHKPELQKLKFCKRFDPPRVLVKYDVSYDIELEDSEGNPLGFSIQDLHEQDLAEQWERFEAEKQEQLAEVSDREKERFLRDLSESTGVPIEDIRAEVEGRSANHGADSTNNPQPAESSEPPLTEIQEQALAEAQRQNNGKPLTEEDRQHIIRATAPASPDPDADPFAEL